MKTNAAKARALDEAGRAYCAYEEAKRACVEAERVYKVAWRACKEEQGEPAKRRRGKSSAEDAT